MKITITLLCICATLFLAGCDVKDPIYNTPHPDKGAIVITADWTQRGEGIATPAKYITEAAGTSFTLHEPVAALAGLFVPERTELLGYNPAAHVTVKDGVATVDNDPDNAGMQHPDPGVLLGGTVTADVVADDTVSVVLPMRQLFRKIAFEVAINGGDSRRIVGIEARLEGVAPSVDLRTGEVTGSAAAVSVPFVLSAEKLTGHRVGSGDDSGRGAAYGRGTHLHGWHERHGGNRFQRNVQGFQYRQAPSHAPYR